MLPPSWRFLPRTTQEADELFFLMLLFAVGFVPFCLIVAFGVYLGTNSAFLGVVVSTALLLVLFYHYAYNTAVRAHITKLRRFLWSRTNPL